MSDTQRNFLIIIAIAVAGFAFKGAFGATSYTLFFILRILFAIAILYAIYQWYTNNQTTINSMDSKWRLMLQASIVGGMAVVVTGQVYPSWSSAGPPYAVMFFALLALCGYCGYNAWQHRRGW